MWLVKYGFLDISDDITVFTDNLGQRDLPDFRQLGFTEPGRSIIGLVPEAITFLQLLKLDTDYASEGGANQRPLQRSFTQAAGEKVDIFNARVNLRNKMIFEMKT